MNNFTTGYEPVTTAGIWQKVIDRPTTDIVLAQMAHTPDKQTNL